MLDIYPILTYINSIVCIFWSLRKEVLEIIEKNGFKVITGLAPGKKQVVGLPVGIDA
jgi:hypothetical protein